MSTSKYKEGFSKQKTLIIIGAFLAVLGIAAVYKNTATAPEKKSDTTTQQTSQDSVDPNLLNIQIIVPDGGQVVQLVDGKADSISDGSGFAQLGNVLAIHQTEAGQDVFAELDVNYGGSGVFVYVALIHEQDGQYRHTSSALVGDRVKLEGVDTPSDPISSYSATATFLDRGENDPMSVEPTIQRTFDLSIIDHVIQNQQAPD